MGARKQHMKTREERFGKDWTFKRQFYSKLDGILDTYPIQTLDKLQPHIEELIALSAQIDGKQIYQPLKNFEVIRIEMDYFLYGLLHWADIRKMLLRDVGAKQVDIISQFALDKVKISFFLYTLGKMDVLEKSKSGRYNFFHFVKEEMSKKEMVCGWSGLFCETNRPPILDK